MLQQNLKHLVGVDLNQAWKEIQEASKHAVMLGYCNAYFAISVHSG